MRQFANWQAARLEAATDVARDIRMLTLEPIRFEPPAPGAHLQVEVQVEGRPQTRHYSLLDRGADRRYRIAVKHLPDSRGGSRYLHTLAPGAALRIAGPANHFPLRHGRPEYLLVAGGIGITPIRFIATALAEQGARLRLFYAARTAEDLAFAADLAGRLDGRLELFVESDGRRIDLEAAFAALHPAAETYLCGPIGMLEAAKSAWAVTGRPIENLRFETFGASGRHATAPFVVRIPHLAREVAVPRDRSMLDALEDAGIGVIWDCRRGECGLCQVRILATDGVVDHRDVFFSDDQKAANTHLCACVSRMASGSVTIETAERRREVPA